MERALSRDQGDGFQPGFSRSIYAIRDHTEINPVLCDSNLGESPEQQLKKMIDAARKHSIFRPP